MEKNLPGIRQPPKQHPLPRPRKPAVVTQPHTYQCLLAGVKLITDAIRPTLGPLPRLVALEALRRSDPPELLDDGATIARRIIAVKPRGCDVGAMMLRGALWQMRQEVGDGSTTMGLLYQAIFAEGVRAVIQQGSNAMLLRYGLEKGQSALQAALMQQTIPLEDRQEIEKVALGMCQGDRELAAMFGEIFDIVGPEGMIVVEKWNRLGIEREYVEGTYWDLSGWFSRLFAQDPRERLESYEDAALLISDLKLTEPDQVVPVLERCLKAGVKRLVILAAEVSDRVIGLLVMNNQVRTIQSMAVRTPRITEQDRAAVMEDIAVLSGGRPFFAAAGDRLERFQPADLGRVRRAWASESQFGIFAGSGDPRAVRQHIARVSAMFRTASPKEEHARNELQKRLGRLSGGTAILRIGALTDTELAVRKELANRAMVGLRNTLRSGVLPGGGVALLAARSALAGLPAENEEDRMAYKILSRALEEPLRAIAANAGFVPDVVVDRVLSAAPGSGLDACTGKIGNMAALGIYDAALVLKKALEIAISGAAMALTTDIIIHHARPVEQFEP